ncbi:MAG: bile acid:sodium symporter family protein [Enterobacteriaceae bacterium]
MRLGLIFRIDRFLLLLISVVVIATLFPCGGSSKVFFDQATVIAIALLFFMHGARLSRSAIMAGIGHWRLHLLVIFSTFILFPLLGLAMRFNPGQLIPPEIIMGFLYLCAMPSTVQSSIAYTSMAKGNVVAAVCSASASSLLGVFISPLLVNLLLHAQGEEGPALFSAIGNIFMQLMLPFIVGHLARPWIAQWMEKNRSWISRCDRISILLVVYTAFSEAVVGGIWHQVTPWMLLLILLLSALLLAIVITWNTWLARRIGFSIPDEVTLVFCGSKKSLVNGIPMAHVLFPAVSVGIMVLPLMVFHQLQLMVCAFLAQRYAQKQGQ